MLRRYVNRKIPVKGLVFLAGACLIIGIGLILFVGKRPTDEIYPSDYASKTVHYRFQIRNTTNQPVSDANFFVHAPLKQTGTQRCDGIEASHPYELVTDSVGNQVLKFTFKTFAPFATKVVSVRANLMLATTPVAFVETDPNRFAVPTADGDADDIAVRQLAFQLKSENVHATAVCLYRWIADNIAYSGYSPDEKGAHYALSKKQGDCTEFADLFVALARAADIPARRVSGYLAHENSVLKPANFHDWAEFYENGVWRIVDAQQRNFDARYSDYIAMRIYDHSPHSGPIDGFHRFYVHGKGLKAKMDS